MSVAVGTEEGWILLIDERYNESSGPQIDRLQAAWGKSLRLAVPEMPEDRMFDLLLCSREAVLNGIQHGCGVCPDKPCAYQVALHPASQIVRVVVDDPGAGHDFDWSGHAKAAGEQMLEEHRGLILMHRIPAVTRVERGGARVTMEFLLKPAACATAAAA